MERSSFFPDATIRARALRSSISFPRDRYSIGALFSVTRRREAARNFATTTVTTMSSLPGYYNGHLLVIRASSAVLSNHYNGVLAGRQWLGKMAKVSVRSNIWHGLAVYDECCSRLSAPDNLHHPPMELRAVDLQHHLLRLALRHQSKLERVADFAGAFFLIHRRHVPEIITAIQAA